MGVKKGKMKRQRGCIVEHGDGTWSGYESTTMIERIQIFKEAQFVISGYHDMQQYELMELLFHRYGVDGIVIRRIFDHCVFSFLGFTRDQIDDVMCMLQRRKKPSQVHYSFIDCQVLSDGLLLDDYILRRDSDTTLLLNGMTKDVKTSMTTINFEAEYNLKEMTHVCRAEKPGFSEKYHECAVERRETHKILKKKRQEYRATKKCKITL